MQNHKSLLVFLRWFHNEKSVPFTAQGAYIYRIGLNLVRTRNFNLENFLLTCIGCRVIKITVIYQLSRGVLHKEAHPIVKGNPQLPETFYKMEIGRFLMELGPFSD